MAVRVIGLGQRAAGDDGVGLDVLDALAASAPAGAELHRVSDSAELVELLQGAERVVIVDAAVGAGPPGSVRVLRAGDLDSGPVAPLSSHGMSVAAAIELSSVLGGGGPEVHIVAVAIERPNHYGTELSRPVAAAVPSAVQVVRRLLSE